MASIFVIASRSFVAIATLILLNTGVVSEAHAVVAVKGGKLLEVVNQYYTALEAKDLVSLGKTVDPSLIVLEGTYKNLGWIDYSNNHIGPEMKEWKSFSTSGRKVLHVEEIGSMGYVVEELSYQIVLQDKTVNLSAAETFVLVKSQGAWKIKHVHSSSKVIKP